MIPFDYGAASTLSALTVAWYIYLYLRKRSAPSLSNVRGPPPLNFLFGVLLCVSYQRHLNNWPSRKYDTANLRREL